MSDQGFHRKVIHISAYDSPNVKLGMEQVRRGIKPTNTIVIPGVISWSEVQKRLATWDQIRIHIGILGLFYDGAETRLYPGEWIERAHLLHDHYTRNNVPRKAKAIGIDCGEGVSDTTMTAVDEKGIVEVWSKKTPNTAVIVKDAIEFMNRHREVFHSRVVFDNGGGGKQVADMVRERGYDVRTVFFGGSPVLPIKYGIQQVGDKIDNREDKAAYANLRAQMYYELREMIDPVLKKDFAIPRTLTELVRQMTPLPLWYDEKERIYLPPKQLRTDKRKGRLDDSADTKTVTINKLVGCSPDQVDSLALAVHGMIHGKTRIKAVVY